MLHHRLLSLLFLVLSGIMTATAAKVDTITITTKLLPEPMTIQVITPDVKDANRKFPTTYLLNGYDGDYTSWTVIRKDLADLADKYGMVMVLPSGMDSWYFDAPANPKMKMETFFTTELVPYIDSHYPTIQDPAQRAITGLSMGGHGALWLAMRHSDIWKNGGSTSGGVNIVPFGTRWKIPKALGPNPTRQTLYNHSVASQAAKLVPGQVNIIFDCGVDDFFHTVNANLHDQLVKAKIPHDYISRPGNHSRTYWANSLPYQLMFFNENFKKAAAKAAN